MSIWIRTLWVATVLIVPGGFLVFLIYLAGRTVLQALRKARSQANGGSVSMEQVFAQIHWQEVLREARTSFGIRSCDRLA